ncbi:MAG: hypothetical protein COA56_11960 [Dehalococcoidia bacterium]|nr:MAG: hypothetical protein COA56_11960 [Dehalococcoidia bacterium]
MVLLIRLVQFTAGAAVLSFTFTVHHWAVDFWGFPDHWIKYALILPVAIHNYYYGHGLILKFNALVRWLSEGADRRARKIAKDRKIWNTNSP